MKHLDLLCVAAEKESTLKRLRELGVVHIDLVGAAGMAVTSAMGELANAEKAVRLILKARGNAKDVLLREHSVAEALAIDADRETLMAEEERLTREIKIYEPYGDFDPELAKKLLDRGIDLSEELPPTLPEMRLSRMQEKLARVKNRISIDTEKLATIDEKPILREYPALSDRINFEAAKEKMSEHGAIAVISGWIPERLLPELMKHVSGAYDTDLWQSVGKPGWGVLVRDPEEGETPPTLIEPMKLFRPVKALFEGLGISPAYEEADVSIPFMCYFSLFFAMLVGDGAYGLICLAGTIWGWKKFGCRAKADDPKSVATHSWLVLMTVFSLATIAWGALSNTWFGAQIPWCKSWATVRWLGGEGAAVGHEYDNMMFLCFTIGVSHLMLARISSGISRLNSLSCLQEFGWAGIVLFMYIVTNTIVGIFNGIPTWSYWMFGISFFIVFKMAKGIEKGMLFLNAMSVLGDIISYVRLFAVGLASVKVAENFNSMACELGLPIWIKWLPLVLVLTLGHVMNLAMAALSVLVHAVRLNTLEFSNHRGISWAGYAFKPFRKTKE